METYFSIQAIIFLKACLAGVILGFIYDVFRILRIAFSDRKFIVFLEDILFFAIASIFTFRFFIENSHGQLRFFIIVGEVAGFVLYYFTMGSIVFRAANIIIDFIRKVCSGIYRFLCKPVFKLFRFGKKQIKRLITYIRNKFKNNPKNLKKDLKKGKKLLYNGHKKKNKRKNNRNHKIKGVDKNEKHKNKKKE